jgi:hypothetical protein
MTTITALPTQVDLNLYQGDDFTMTLTVTNPDDSEVDLAETIVEAQVRKTANDEEVLARFTPAYSGNVITLWLPGSESAKISGSAVWDCHVTDAGGRITTLAAGKITTTAEVTR